MARFYISTLIISCRRNKIPLYGNFQGPPALSDMAKSPNGTFREALRSARFGETAMDWWIPLVRDLQIRLPRPTHLRTLAEASSFLMSFPLQSDSGIGYARQMIFAALRSGDLLDIEIATSAVEAVILDKGLA